MPWSPRSGELRFAVEHADGRAVVRLAGELDRASAAIAHVVLDRAGGESAEVVLDLSRVTFVDLSGVRFLVNAQHRARAADRRLMFRRPHRTVRRMLELTGGQSLVNIEHSERIPGPAASGLAAVLDAALAPAMQIAEADMAAAQLWNPAGDTLEIVAHRGLAPAFLDFFEFVDCGPSNCVGALPQGSPIWIHDVLRAPALAESPALEVILDAGVRALAALPVRTGEGNVIGVLSVLHRRRNAWTQERRIELQQLAQMSAHRCLEAIGRQPAN
jgi:anti-anti-sigma factor